MKPLLVAVCMHGYILFCEHTRVADLHPLAALTGLSSLNVSCTRVVDVAALVALTGLTSLNVSCKF